MVEKINTGPKTLGEASKLALAELLLKAAKNPKSEITMDDYNYYIETGKLNFAGGGMASINEMTRPIGMAAGGPIPPEDNVLEKLKKNDPDKELRDKGALPPLREKEKRTLLSSKMHPLVVFKEMYDQYRIDGGEMSFKEFFDMIQIELNKEASS